MLDSDQVHERLEKFLLSAAPDGGRPSIRALARKAGLGEASIRKWLNGEASPTLRSLVAIANALNISLLELASALSDEQPKSHRSLTELIKEVEVRPLDERLRVIEVAASSGLNRGVTALRHRPIAAESPAAYLCLKGKVSTGAGMERLQELIRTELVLKGLTLKEYALSARLNEKQVRTLLEQGEFVGDRFNILSQLARHLTHPERGGFFYDAEDLEIYCGLGGNSPSNGESHHATNGV